MSQASLLCPFDKLHEQHLFTVAAVNRRSAIRDAAGGGGRGGAGGVRRRGAAGAISANLGESRRISAGFRSRWEGVCQDQRIEISEYLSAEVGWSTISADLAYLG